MLQTHVVCTEIQINALAWSLKEYEFVLHSELLIAYFSTVKIFKFFFFFI